ncbi:MAG TPA: DHA2 family efflux MFS transporter permease subunit [Streptosporangiaceae bacterium]|nr:DHA2 family efflux MFS transporter permease subunit [Streptosporangiaceae bacterium]
MEHAIGTAAAPGAAARRAPALILVLTAVAFFMVALDALVVVTALPAIHRSLGGSVGTLEWSVNSYGLTFAAGIVTAAALGDRLGRRRIYVLGLLLFTVASAACALAPTAAALIAARAVQGLGAAAVTPLSLTIATSAFPPAKRGSVMGVIGAIAGLAVAGGPLVGGGVVQGLDWHWIFWINVPVGVAAAALSLVKLPESRGPVSRLDLPGVPLVAGAAVALTWGLIQVGDTGWTGAKTVTMLIVGVVLLAAFVVREQRAAAPMLPLRLFRSVPFAAANGAAFMMNAAIMAAAFLTVQYFQLGIGYGPMATGLRLLPWTATPMVIAPLAGILADRIGTRPLLATGLLLQAAGLAWVAGIASAGGGYARFVLPLMIAGVGISMSIPTVTAAALGAVEPADIGRASGVVNTLQRFGGAFGIAIATAVFSAHGHLGSAASVTSGYRPALAVAAGLSLIGGIVALAIRQRPARKSWPSHEPVPAAEALQPATR